MAQPLVRLGPVMCGPPRGKTPLGHAMFFQQGHQQWSSGQHVVAQEEQVHEESLPLAAPTTPVPAPSVYELGTPLTVEAAPRSLVAPV